MATFFSFGRLAAYPSSQDSRALAAKYITDNGVLSQRTCSVGPQALGLQGPSGLGMKSSSDGQSS